MGLKDLMNIVSNTVKQKQLEATDHIIELIQDITNIPYREISTLDEAYEYYIERHPEYSSTSKEKIIEIARPLLEVDEQKLISLADTIDAPAAGVGLLVQAYKFFEGKKNDEFIDQSLDTASKAALLGKASFGIEDELHNPYFQILGTYFLTLDVALPHLVDVFQVRDYVTELVQKKQPEILDQLQDKVSTEEIEKLVSSKMGKFGNIINNLPEQYTGKLNAVTSNVRSYIEGVIGQVDNWDDALARGADLIFAPYARLAPMIVAYDAIGKAIKSQE